MDDIQDKCMRISDNFDYLFDELERINIPKREIEKIRLEQQILMLKIEILTKQNKLK